MYIIAGLGNPDRKYQNTRHNIGFEVIDAIAGKNQITVGERRHKAIIGRGYVGGRKAVLVKPQTYMNLSGEGSAGGHNGLKNIILHLGHDEFCRVKMGVGEKPDGYDLADYVLGHFSDKEREIMDESITRAAEAVEVMIAEGPDAAMNQFNKKNR